MEPPDGATPECLLDHALMVDYAVLVQRRSEAEAAAARLYDELILHDRAFEPTRRYLEPDVAEALASAALTVRTGVRLLVDELRKGTTWPRPALRSQVEQLILQEAAAVGDCASAYVD